MSALLAFALLVSGLHGVVTRGPTQPVCRIGTPCTKPAVGAVLLFSQGGRVAARVRAGAGGRYSVRLRPGLYAVRLSRVPRIGEGILPREVRVPSGAAARVDFSIDTGIR